MAASASTAMVPETASWCADARLDWHNLFSLCMHKGCNVPCVVPVLEQGGDFLVRHPLLAGKCHAAGAWKTGHIEREEAFQHDTGAFLKMSSQCEGLSYRCSLCVV